MRVLFAAAVAFFLTADLCFGQSMQAGGIGAYRAIAGAPRKSGALESVEHKLDRFIKLPDPPEKSLRDLKKRWESLRAQSVAVTHSPPKNAAPYGPPPAIPGAKPTREQVRARQNLDAWQHKIKKAELAAEAAETAYRAAYHKLHPDPRIVPGPRTWTSADGRQTIRAEIVALTIGGAVLRSENGNQQSIPLDRLAFDDRRYAIAATMPPELKSVLDRRRQKQSIHLDRLRENQAGITEYSLEILQIIDAQNAIARYGRGLDSPIVWLAGFHTEKMADGDFLPPGLLVRVGTTKSYPTALGESKTVRTFHHVDMRPWLDSQ